MKKHSRGGMIVWTCTIMSNLPLLRWSAPTTTTGNASLSPAHWSAFSQQTNRPLAGSQEEHCESTSGTQGMPVSKRTLNEENIFFPGWRRIFWKSSTWIVLITCLKILWVATVLDNAIVPAITELMLWQKNCLTITPEKKKERAKKSVIDEAGIISSLPDNKRLPVLFGVITEKEPICLVTQFYGVGGKSVTHQAENTSGMLTSQDCIDLFTEICSPLQHVHSWGIIPNKIKANNAVLELKAGVASKQYTPVLIDFGRAPMHQFLQCHHVAAK